MPDINNKNPQKTTSSPEPTTASIEKTNANPPNIQVPFLCDLLSKVSKICVAEEKRYGTKTVKVDSKIINSKAFVKPFV